LLRLSAAESNDDHSMTRIVIAFYPCAFIMNSMDKKIRGCFHPRIVQLK
jgi:hypothetical protein